jgi:hypothetical protein
MLKAELDKAKNLLHVVLSQHVTVEDTGHWREQLGQLLPGMQPAFKLLIDWTDVDSMDINCVPDIAWSMEAMDKAGVSKVVRILPDPHKDIGVNIMALFHYRRTIPMVTCDTMEEALRALAE